MAWPSLLVRHRLSPGMAVTSRTASSLAWHGRHFSYGIVSHGMTVTSCTASSLAWHDRHFLYGIVLLGMTVTSCTASSLARHGRHFSYGIISRLAWPSLLANIGITFAITSTVAGWAGVSCSSAGWTARQFKNTLDKCRILKNNIYY